METIYYYKLSGPSKKITVAEAVAYHKSQEKHWKALKSLSRHLAKDIVRMAEKAR